MSSTRDAETTQDRRRLRAAALGAVVCLCVVLLGPRPAHATVLQKLDTVSIFRQSSRIAVGTVLSTSAEQFPGGVRTAVRMAVSDPLKGGATGTTVFYVPGGRLPDGRTIVVEGMATFEPGETACVFIDGRGWVVGGYQGKVGVAAGRIVATGQRLSMFTDAVKAAGGTSKSPLLPQGLVDPIGAGPDAVSDAAVGGPTITSITPGTVAAGIGATITITGSGFGSSPGSVLFFFQPGQSNLITSSVSPASWSDTRITCVVPIATVNGYPASPGSGPVVVRTAGGAASNSGTVSISFGYGQCRWLADSQTHPSVRVTYYVNPGGVPRAQTLIDAAAGVWNAAGADFRFVSGGTTTADPGLSLNGENIISWANGLPSGVIAWAWFGYDGSGDMTEAHVEYSTAFSWGDGSGGTMDIESIGMHEIGHWLNLRDLYGSGDSAKVMYGFSSLGTVKRTLSAGDRAGILWIYGAAPVVLDDTPPVTTSTRTAPTSAPRRSRLPRPTGAPASWPPTTASMAPARSKGPA